MLNRTIFGALAAAAVVGGVLVEKALKKEPETEEDEEDDEIHFITIEDGDSEEETPVQDVSGKSEAVKEICGVYPYLTPDFVEGILDTNTKFNEQYEEALDYNTKLLSLFSDYKRMYETVKCTFYESLLLYRMNKEWKAVFSELIGKAAESGLLMILAEEGASLYPMLEEFMKEQKTLDEHQSGYVKKLAVMTKRTARTYPYYLRETKTDDAYLTPREYEVLLLSSSDLSQKEMAERLNLAVSSLKFHCGNIYRKLNASNRMEAVSIARQKGLI